VTEASVNNEQVQALPASDWYKDAVIYELHVRAFFDNNGDGIGDFAGLTAKLDYLKDLGVTALWLLPFYPSPGLDDGYDIGDYTDVNPDYGTMRDVRVLIREALGYGAPHFPLADHYDPSRPEWMYGNVAHEKLTDSGDWREHIDLHHHRYMREDISQGLALLVSLADWARVPAPTATGLLALATAIVGEDLRRGDRTWERLGLADLSRSDLRRLLDAGLPGAV